MRFLGFKDEFFRHTGLMFIGMGLFNLFNLLYHFFMLRMLPPVDYGHLNTLVALFMVISVPAGTVQTTVTKFVSSFQVQNQFDRVKGLLRHILLLMLIIGLSLFLLISLGSSLISSFLQISSYGLVLLLGVSLFFAMVIPVPWGGLQGLQQFGSLTLNLIINGGIKFVLSIAFVLLGLGVLGALGAVAISYFVTTILSLLILKMCVSQGKKKANPGLTPAKRTQYDFSEVYSYSLPVGLTLLCFMVLTNIDLILVKHFFRPIEAGYYSIAQMVGKIILFLPLPIVMVMFPKLASLKMENQDKKALSILGYSLTIAVLLCGGATIVSFLFPSLMIRVLSGKVYLECIPLVGIFSVNMTFFSLSLILLYYQLSTDGRGFLYALVLFTLIQSGLIVLFHKSLIQVLRVVGMVAFSLSVINFYLAYRPYKNKGKERR
ncbi:MAG: oligosaccharide flippase family protein [Thermodesulfobacteriota bacterium]